VQTIVNNTGITSASTPATLYLRPAILYYLRLEFPHTDNNAIRPGSSQRVATTPLILYKLGYTTSSLHERVHGKPVTYTKKRVGNKRKVLRHNGHNGMGLPPGTSVYIISTLQHRNAALVYAWEQYLHNKYASERYKGLPLMANGNTELYIRDILDLDY
jgi:hypothetical protein